MRMNNELCLQLQIKQYICTVYNQQLIGLRPNSIDIIILLFSTKTPLITIIEMVVPYDMRTETHRSVPSCNDHIRYLQGCAPGNINNHLTWPCYLY